MPNNHFFSGGNNHRAGSILLWIFIAIILAAWSRLAAQQPIGLEVEYTPRYWV